LSGAASYLKCTVVDRMDCGDHYVLLASIDDGKVLSDGANTMFHFRQSGQEY
jgi:flavin reductase (DIM6/NTAB) family NADH-FMN oxidoreductase RutF